MFTTTSNFRRHINCPYDLCSNAQRGCKNPNVPHDFRTVPCVFNQGHEGSCNVLCHSCNALQCATTYAVHYRDCMIRNCHTPGCGFSGNAKQCTEHEMTCETTRCDVCAKQLVGTAGSGYLEQHQSVCLRCRVCNVLQSTATHAVHYRDCRVRNCHTPVCRFLGNAKQCAEHEMTCETTRCDVCDRQLVGCTGSGYLEQHQSVCYFELVDCSVCHDTVCRGVARAHQEQCLAKHLVNFSKCRQFIGSDTMDALLSTASTFSQNVPDSERECADTFILIMQGIPSVVERLEKSQSQCASQVEQLEESRSCCASQVEQLEESRACCANQKAKLEKQALCVSMCVSREAKLKSQGIKITRQAAKIQQLMRRLVAKNKNTSDDSNDADELYGEDDSSDVDDSDDSDPQSRCHSNIIFHDGSEGWCPCVRDSRDCMY
jgi:phage FluMu protein Com